MSDQPASFLNAVESATHLFVTSVPAAPPLPPQQPPEPGLVGSAAPSDVVNVDSAWNFVFSFLPTLLRFSEASDDFDFFMYSMKAGIATAARMPMIATTI